MFRFLILCVFMLPLAALASCKKTLHSEIEPSIYYKPISNKLSGGELKLELNKLIRGHTKYSYTPCVWEILKETDVSPTDGQYVVTFYTNRSIHIDRRDDGSNNPDSWNREHIWAKSHGFPKKSQHAYTDVHHIRVADRSVNSDRSDNDFDMGGAPDDECTECKEGQGTWEPPEIVKGDVARMMFYMDIRYDGNDGSKTPNLELVDLVDTPRTDKSDGYGHFGKLCTLLQWHINDPVSDAERRRNNVVFSWQGNRNPFIDRPYYASLIWGAKCNLNITQVGEKPDALNKIVKQLSTIEEELKSVKADIEAISKEEQP